MAGILSEAAQGGAMAPQLADAAAQAGAPPPGAGQAPPAGAQPPMPPPAGTEPGAPAPGTEPGAPAPGMAPGAPEIPEEEATPEEQQEYERSMSAVARVLYGNDKIANSIVDQVDPNDKVSSTAKVSMLFVRELDKKLNMGKEVVAPVTEEVVARVSELAEARHGMQYNPAEMEQILGATWEGVVAMFEGGSEGEVGQDFQQFVSQFDEGTMSQLKQQYEAALNG